MNACLLSVEIAFLLSVDMESDSETESIVTTEGERDSLGLTAVGSGSEQIVSTLSEAAAFLQIHFRPALLLRRHF